MICPYCGHEESDSWEFSDEGETDCPSCDQTFTFERNIEVTYTTSKKSCDEDQHDYILNSEHPYMCSCTKYENGVWIDQPRENWKYYRIEKCTECDNKIYIDITKEEYYQNSK